MERDEVVKNFLMRKMERIEDKIEKAKEKKDDLIASYIKTFDGDPIKKRTELEKNYYTYKEGRNYTSRVALASGIFSLIPGAFGLSVATVVGVSNTVLLGAAAGIAMLPFAVSGGIMLAWYKFYHGAKKEYNNIKDFLMGEYRPEIKCKLNLKKLENKRDKIKDKLRSIERQRQDEMSL